MTADGDSTPLSILSFDFNRGVHRTFTQEVQLLSKPGSPFDWIVGGFLLGGTSGYGEPFGFGIFGSAVGGGAGLNYHIKTRSYSTFGEATFPLTTSTGLTIGARWTQDKRRLSGAAEVLDPISHNILLSIPSTPVAAKFSKPTWRLMLDHHFANDTMSYASYSRGFAAREEYSSDQVRAASCYSAIRGCDTCRRSPHLLV